MSFILKLGAFAWCAILRVLNAGWGTAEIPGGSTPYA